MPQLSRAIPCSVLLALLAAPSAARPQEPEHETTRITDRVHMFRYRSHNTIFVVADDGVVAFDPISVEAARILRQEIRRVSAEPIRTIIYSHHHADHITGARELAPDAAIVAHVQAARRLAADPDPEIPPPTLTFADSMRLSAGATEIRLLYLGRNHSDNMIVAHLPAEGLVFAVDFVSNDRVGYRDLPGYYFPEIWESLERLQHLEYRRAVFGHGPPGTKADVYEQIAYWTDLRRAVESAIAEGLSEREAVDSIELPEYADWNGYDDWFAMNVRAVYRHYAAGGTGGR